MARARIGGSDSTPSPAAAAVPAHRYNDPARARLSIRAEPPQRLVQDAQITDGPGRSLLMFVVAVQRVIDVPEPEVVVGPVARWSCTRPRYQSACQGNASRSNRQDTTIIFPLKCPVGR